MAGILDTEKIDFLWKRIIFGVTKTAGALVKFGSNETISSAAPVLLTHIWAQGDQIPAQPAQTSIVTAHVAETRVQATTDPTSPVNQTWIATLTPGDLVSRLVDFVPPTFGPGYAVKVYLGDPHSGNAARIFQDTTNEEFIFDYSAGVLIFTGTLPTGKTATIGAGTFGVANGVYLELYRYVGNKGFVPGGGGGATYLDELDDVDIASAGPADGDVLTYASGVWTAAPAGGATGLGTMSTQDADDVDITGGSIANVTLTNVTFDAGEF